MDKKTTITPLLYTAQQAADALSVSLSHFHALNNQGKIPQARRLGKSARWSVDELRKWIAAGCESRAEWIEGASQ